MLLLVQWQNSPQLQLAVLFAVVIVSVAVFRPHFRKLGELFGNSSRWLLIQPEMDN